MARKKKEVPVVSRVSVSEKGGKSRLTITPAGFGKRLWNYLTAWYTILGVFGIIAGLVCFFGYEGGRDQLFPVLCFVPPAVLCLVLFIVSYIRFGRGNAKIITLCIDGEQLALSIGRKERSFPIPMITLENCGNAAVSTTELRIYAGKSRKTRKRLLRLLQMDIDADIKVIQKFASKYKVRFNDKKDYTREPITPSGAYV